MLYWCDQRGVRDGDILQQPEVWAHTKGYTHSVLCQVKLLVNACTLLNGLLHKMQHTLAAFSRVAHFDVLRTVYRSAPCRLCALSSHTIESMLQKSSIVFGVKFPR